jgi:electron transfer flavoprotein beta subunit
VARELAAVAADHDLVLLGNDAADSGDFQVGIRLAYELGRPVVNGVSTVAVEDGVAVARGEGPDGHETFRVPLPAVVTILEGGVEPRYPSVPGRMKAKKVAIVEREPTGAPAGAGRVRFTLPPPVSSDVQILGEGAAAAPAVVDLFERIGVISK